MPQLRRYLKFGAAGIVGVGATVMVVDTLRYRSVQARKAHVNTMPPPIRQLPSRFEHLTQLARASQTGEAFDVLVIGGGATGSGVALDAATRGLRVCLLDRDDFASGTSSRSTKLIHGGVRYLEMAFKQLDFGQFAVVQEALRERENLMYIGPHLSHSLPIMLPIYRWIDLPQFWIGLKLYDLIARSTTLDRSHFISPNRALRLFPMLKDKGLKGAMIYFDGQHNDARMGLSIALTAAHHGAVTVNHVKVTDLIKDDLGRVVGVVAHDVRDPERKDLRLMAKAVVNATGPYCDDILRMEDPAHKALVKPSLGTHITLPKVYSPDDMGLISKTKDGRVLFFLPWEHSTLAGTTDTACQLSDLPQPPAEDVRFILEEIQSFLHPKVSLQDKDVQSAWTGIRPLAVSPTAAQGENSTKNLARSHLCFQNTKGGLVTITGGKWTTYRQMAEDTVDMAVASNPELKAKAKPCNTKQLMLTGGHEYSEIIPILLAQRYGVPQRTAEHLAQHYGDKAWEVAELAVGSGFRPLVPGNRHAGNGGYPFLEAEVEYAIREYACTASDFLARRTPLAFLDFEASVEVAPRIVELMGNRFGWSAEQRQAELKDTLTFLQTFRPPVQVLAKSK